MAAIKSELIFYGTTVPNTNSQINEKIIELENTINFIKSTTIPSITNQINLNTNNIKDIFSVLEANGFIIEGEINENKTIILPNLGKGVYTLKFENEDGTETIIDTIIIEE